MPFGSIEHGVFQRAWLPAARCYARISSFSANRFRFGALNACRRADIFVVMGVAGGIPYPRCVARAVHRPEIPVYVVDRTRPAIQGIAIRWR